MTDIKINMASIKKKIVDTLSDDRETSHQNQTKAFTPTTEKTCEPNPPVAVFDSCKHIEEEVIELKEMISLLKNELEGYLTSKHQFKEYLEFIEKKEAENTNAKFIRILEQLSMMREDFFKLCKGMEVRINDFSSTDVLNSFQAYSVDMENVLLDCGVNVGPFTQFDRVNTIHQKIIDVIPTKDESKNGLIAERISDGYEFKGRVLFKERVNIYKFTEVMEKDISNVCETVVIEDTTNENIRDTCDTVIEELPKKREAVDILEGDILDIKPKRARKITDEGLTTDEDDIMSTKPVESKTTRTTSTRKRNVK